MGVMLKYLYYSKFNETSFMETIFRLDTHNIVKFSHVVLLYLKIKNFILNIFSVLIKIDLFSSDFSEVFATASKNDVRLWSAITMQELLRIRVKNFSCSNVVFAKDGKSILTSWNDGVIRAFTPLTGRLIYEIYNAHNKGVSALGMTKHGQLLVSGGCEGQVRLWKISPQSQSLECTLKEHKVLNTLFLSE